MEADMEKILYGAWKEELNGLSPGELQGKHVLINESNKRIVHSPSVYLKSIGAMSDEIAADPGQIICYLNQNLRHPGVNKNSYVVIDYELPLERWLNFYFKAPHMIPAKIDVENDEITVMGVPITLEVLKSYPVDVLSELNNILHKKDFSQHQRSVAETKMMVVLLIK
jgi:hypothetical protein